jgi:hypothetical protein
MLPHLTHSTLTFTTATVMTGFDAAFRYAIVAVGSPKASVQISSHQLDCHVTWALVRAAFALLNSSKDRRTGHDFLEDMVFRSSPEYSRLTTSLYGHHIPQVQGLEASQLKTAM